MFSFRLRNLRVVAPPAQDAATSAHFGLRLGLFIYSAVILMMILSPVLTSLGKPAKQKKLTQDEGKP